MQLRITNSYTMMFFCLTVLPSYWLIQYTKQIYHYILHTLYSWYVYCILYIHYIFYKYNTWANNSYPSPVCLPKPRAGCCALTARSKAFCDTKEVMAFLVAWRTGFFMIFHIVNGITVHCEKKNISCSQNLVFWGEPPRFCWEDPGRFQVFTGELRTRPGTDHQWDRTKKPLNQKGPFERPFWMATNISLRTKAGWDKPCRCFSHFGWPLLNVMNVTTMPGPPAVDLTWLCTLGCTHHSELGVGFMFNLKPRFLNVFNLSLWSCNMANLIGSQDTIRGSHS